nr:hypothetical protein [Candidatus Microthrix sp.]
MVRSPQRNGGGGDHTHGIGDFHVARVLDQPLGPASDQHGFARGKHAVEQRSVASHRLERADLRRILGGEQLENSGLGVGLAHHHSVGADDRWAIMNDRRGHLVDRLRRAHPPRELRQLFQAPPIVGPFGHVGDQGADPERLVAIVDTEVADRAHQLVVRRCRRPGGDLDVGDRFAGAQNAANQRVELFCHLWNDLGQAAPQVIGGGGVVDLCERLVNQPKPQLGVEEPKPAGRTGHHRLEDRPGAMVEDPLPVTLHQLPGEG